MTILEIQALESIHETQKEIYRMFYGKKAMSTALVSGLLVSTPLFADGMDASNFYAGVGVGHADLKDACDDVPGSCDDTDTGWKLFVGYQFHPNFSVEGGYVDLGEAEADFVISGINVSADVEVDGFFLSGLGSYPITNQLSVFGKFGVLFWDVDSSASGGGISASDDESGSDILFGVGGQFDFTDHIGLRAEWERYNNVGNSDSGTTDIDLISGSLIYRF